MMPIINNRAATCAVMWFPTTLSLVLKTNHIFSRSEAAQLMDESILPARERGNRIAMGRDDEQVFFTGNTDLHETYGEFPLASLDALMDVAQQHRTTPIRNVVDLGSGCGRLAIYMSLTRADWQVHGIELSDTFHNEAMRALNQATRFGCFQSLPGESSGGGSTISLHQGPASSFPSLLEQADLIFCYSTAFESSHFSEEASALVLADSWNDLLSSHCRPGCICITTDKAMDPKRNWRILDRLDVPNPEVMGSNGFVSIFDGPS